MLNFMLARFSVVITSFILILGSCTDETEPTRIFFQHNEQDKQIDILIDSSAFTTFHYSDSLYKPILYPVLDAHGTRITRGFPYQLITGEQYDHPHHAGHWFNYGDVNGYDFWNNSDSVEDKSAYGKIVTSEILEMEGGDSAASFQYNAHWVTNNDELLLKEHTIFSFAGQGNMRFIDRTTTLNAEKPILFEDSKEGLFALRVRLNI